MFKILIKFKTMSQKNRAQIILKILNKIYPKTPIPLKHKNTFTLLISVALSAQTTDLNVNNVTPGNDLTGATVTRIRTLVKYLDADNFVDNSNPYGTPDPNAEFPREIYKIDRKATENREIIQFELAAVFDLAGVRAPQRQCTRKDFPSIGNFIV